MLKCPPERRAEEKVIISLSPPQPLPKFLRSFSGHDGFDFVVGLEGEEVAAVGVLFYLKDGVVFDEHAAVDAEIFMGG